MDASLKSSKKSKKSKTRTADGAPIVLDDISAPLEVPSSDSKPSKKRKRDRETDSTPLVPPTTTDDAEDGEKSKKKKKRKDKSVSEDVTEPVVVATSTLEAVADASEAKASKKDKKKKRKEQEAAAAAAVAALDISEPTTTAASTSTSTPNSQEVDDYLKANSITLKSETVPVTPVLSFGELNIPKELRQVLSKFDKPTPIQACAWPALLAGLDVVGIAETGSGKTLAFGLPAVVHLQKHAQEKGKKAKNLTVLVVAPTRELALQTHETMEIVGAPFGIKSVCVFGGVDKGPQKKLLASRDVRVVVGTPGRLLDLANEGACDLSGVSYLVLDEADRMLDKGFENDIRNIISQTSDGATRQTLMFSATWPESVRKLASTFLRSPFRITVGSDDLTANSRVSQSVEVFEDPRTKSKRLHHLLQSLNHPLARTTKSYTDDSRILVFVLYKKEADRVLSDLEYFGYKGAAIHGDMGQAARLASLDAFKKGTVGLLVATDVAARGLDIPDVGAVINYSFPLTIEDYIHRIGRTGRGGKTGRSITFFTGDGQEKTIAGEFARVLREGGFDAAANQLRDKFPMTLKKKEHSAYGAFFKESNEADKKATKIKF